MAQRTVKKARLFFIFVVVLAGCQGSYADRPHPVVRVFDGDTIKLGNGERVRLIGIDCPERYDNEKLRRDALRTGQDVATIRAEGKRSFDYVYKLVSGKKVFLEFDQERRDKYGRLLAYVWFEAIPDSHSKSMIWPQAYVTERRKNKRGQEGTYVFLNATILKAGYARPMIIPPNIKHESLFRRLYQEAKREKRGLWR